jgi:hypothetical protein
MSIPLKIPNDVYADIDVDIDDADDETILTPLLLPSSEDRYHHAPGTRRQNQMSFWQFNKLVTLDDIFLIGLNRGTNARNQARNLCSKLWFL